jgi:hypothetical protein
MNWRRRRSQILALQNQKKIKMTSSRESRQNHAIWCEGENEKKKPQKKLNFPGDETAKRI